ncbi:nucleotide-binding universal stress UspA family protein [Azospirillum agricola]|uniref:universal stress protein n=1 Tax=Azospirillum agricola TaxID=1720247 RepID=UPI001AE36DBB|nr:universal stress protein [Azospirillum agricola]MBP2227982.1 nucleotide-binding universal stress UspA family protein [Azospirillum agricola]
MSYHVILAPMTGSDTDGHALHAALAVAREFNGHVDALYIDPRPEDTLPLLAQGLPEPVILDMTRTVRAQNAAIRERAHGLFERATTSLSGLTVSGQPERDGPSAAWRTIRGTADALLPREGRKADLIVFGHSTLPGQQAAVEAALFGTGRPVLLVPPEHSAPLGRSVSIAWNGSVEATRAVAAGLPFLHRADSVFVLSTEPRSVDPHDCAGLLRYLRWHGVDAEFAAVRTGLDDLGDGLIRRADELGADLIVMGAYGYSRLRETVFGGVTRFMLRHPNKALLLTH